MLFDLNIRGDALALSPLVVAFSICLVSLGVAVTALCRTAQQANSFGYLGMVLFGAIGGAFVPFNLLPGWARAIAPVTPTYWAMRGLRAVILDGRGLGAIGRSDRGAARRWRRCSRSWPCAGCASTRPRPAGSDARTPSVTGVTGFRGPAWNARNRLRCYTRQRRLRHKGAPVMLDEPALYGSTYVLKRRVNRPSEVVAKTLRDRATVAPSNGFALEDGGTLLVEETPRSSPPVSVGQ